jgi:hypothetical protein
VEAAEMQYNYEKFSSSEYDLENVGGPAPGSKAPDFELATLDGGRQRLLSFSGEFLVVEFGSVTCPLFQTRRRGMEKVIESHPRSDFVVLYVREAHPGSSIPQHRSLDEKLQRAREVKDTDAEQRRILVDDLEGRAHQAFGCYPNAIFIVNRNGCVVYRSDWNDWKAVHKALSQLEAGEPARAKSLFKPAAPPIAWRTLQRSGAGAFADFIKSLPVLIWKNLILRNIRELRGRKHVDPQVTC